MSMQPILFTLLPTLFAAFAVVFTPLAKADREPVLKQIDVPHHYYYREMYLPQLTSGPSSLAWSPDGEWLLYSMAGALWKQRPGSNLAIQLTSGPGYDYQPDWGANGLIVFTRYHGDAMELQLLDPETGDIRAITSGGDVHLEPRWSPSADRIAWVSTQGSGRFHLFVGALAGDTGSEVIEGHQLVAERRTEPSRYYYSAFDHELSPSWSPDGTQLLYVANPGVVWGTGDIYRRPADGSGKPVLVRSEETTWKARPDWSPDGNRVIYSSYLGRQWHQLWITTAAGGGDPFPLTYGDHDVTSARWSPDGKRIAFVSNRGYDTRIWLQEFVGGKRTPLDVGERQYLADTGSLRLSVVDAAGIGVAARVAVVGSDGRSYAPANARLHGDDGFDRDQMAEEIHYFHVQGEPVRLALPPGEAGITVWRGLEYAVSRSRITVPAGKSMNHEVRLEPLDLPADFARWQSGDAHAHMNYAGTYRNTPNHLVQQAAAEDLDVVFNLIVNKEQRIPDVSHFSPDPDPASRPDVLLMHSQEYHTSFWGHLGLLNLQSHLLIPDYSAYANTGAASVYPDNATIARLAHEQSALVGYVHPYDAAPDPAAATPLSHALPLDVALGLVDYIEVVGFSNHRETASVWHRLLNCGFRPVAAAGTDAMANYASLRGPVGLTRVYVDMGGGYDASEQAPQARLDAWVEGLRAGRTMATNGPLLGFTLDGQGPGGEIALPAGGGTLAYNGFMRSIVGVDHLEVIVSGEVAKRIRTRDGGRAADLAGEIPVQESGWVLLRAWNDEASPDVLDIYPYATTNPVYVTVGGEAPRSPADAAYFLAWADRVRAAADAHADYNTAQEKDIVLGHIAAARERFEACR
ncbi:MAG: CehA/McbA family metallohydrolase [Xanthomonadales bacterium]|nr:CehA/McbA family metallohydrolase [Xanthomonadales bacterium]